MQVEHLKNWIHDHVFHVSNKEAERSTQLVMWITAFTMVIEIAAGWWLNSMALLADGWHMSSHAVAIGLSAFAYKSARKFSNDSRFAFGTWKIEILGGFASAVFLLGVAALMLLSSFERLLSPQPIHYKEAIVIAVFGLGINLWCALILGNTHHDDHGHHHSHNQVNGHHHHDLNLKSAYMHVIADAATSVLAIAALVGGWMWGWSWLDPLMGMVGAILVAVWAKGLIHETGTVLLDREMDHPVVEEIKQVLIENSQEFSLHLTDLHVWRVGKNVYSCALSIVTDNPSVTPEKIKAMLSIHEEIVHTTIEINIQSAEK